MDGEDGFLPDISLAERASFYRITPYKSSRPELVLLYNNDQKLRWSLNIEDFTITIWPLVDINKDKHELVDAKGYEKGTYGYVSKTDGIKGSAAGPLNRLSLLILGPEEKKAVEFAITKYLSG